MPRRRSPDGAPAAAQRRGGTTLTPTSGNPPSGGEEGPEPQTRNPASAAQETPYTPASTTRGTIAGSRVLRPPAESADRLPGQLLPQPQPALAGGRYSPKGHTSSGYSTPCCQAACWAVDGRA